MTKTSPLGSTMRFRSRRTSLSPVPSMVFPSEWSCLFGVIYPPSSSWSTMGVSGKTSTGDPLLRGDEGGVVEG